MKLRANLILATLLVPGLALAGTEKLDGAMQPILEQYLAIHAALAADGTAGVAAAARAIGVAAEKLDVGSVTGEHAQHYADLPEKLTKAAAVLAAADGLAASREAFKALSRPMAMWATMSKPKGVVVLFCSMARASWLQKKGEVRNPYYGSEMLTCGEVVGGDSDGMMGNEHGAGHMKH